MRALITGASGFIGGVVAQRLMAEGHAVDALVRRAGSEPAGSRPVAGDLCDETSLFAALESSRPDVVIHLAAEIASQRDGAKVTEVNVGGTARLLAACQALGESEAPRFVFSSTVVTGDAGGRVLDEQTPLPVATAYGRAKQEGEALIAGSGLRHVILRPSHVYGPGGWYEQELLPLLLRPGRFAVIGSGRNLWDLVHVEDVAAAIVLASTVAHAGPTYHVVDDGSLSYGEFMALSAEALGVGPPRRVPVALARAVAGSNAVAAVVRSARSSSALIRSELGWQPRYATAAEGVPATVAALRQAGRL